MMKKSKNITTRNPSNEVTDPIAYGYGCHLGLRGIGSHELESDWPETLASPDFMRGWHFAYDGIGDEEITSQAEAAETSYIDGVPK
jgi:hypothetical protein